MGATLTKPQQLLGRLDELRGSGTITENDYRIYAKLVRANNAALRNLASLMDMTVDELVRGKSVYAECFSTNRHRFSDELWAIGDDRHSVHVEEICLLCGTKRHSKLSKVNANRIGRLSYVRPFDYEFKGVGEVSASRQDVQALYMRIRLAKTIDMMASPGKKLRIVSG